VIGLFHSVTVMISVELACATSVSVSLRDESHSTQYSQAFVFPVGGKFAAIKIEGILRTSDDKQ
jgi:hypothetical protein